MGYATIMLVANAERSFDPVGAGGNSCSSCHAGPAYPPQMSTYSAWGGWAHEPVGGNNAFGPGGPGPSTGYGGV